MIGKTPNDKQGNLFLPLLKDMLDPRRPLYKLADKIRWEEFENEFKKLYREDFGAPSKPIRLMVSLLILKQIENLSDEDLVEKWAENPYYQYFSGETHFSWKLPCDPTDITYFRKRIKKSGVEKIMQVSIQIHGNDGTEKVVCVDTTVQEKNITYPTDLKLHKKIAEQCIKISSREGIDLRQSYKRTIPKLIKDQRFKRNVKTLKKSEKISEEVKNDSESFGARIGKKTSVE